MGDHATWAFNYLARHVANDGVCHAMPVAMWMSLLTYTKSKSADTDLKHAAVGNHAGAATVLVTVL